MLEEKTMPIHPLLAERLTKAQLREYEEHHHFTTSIHNTKLIFHRRLVGAVEIPILDVALCFHPYDKMINYRPQHLDNELGPDQNRDLAVLTQYLSFQADHLRWLKRAVAYRPENLSYSGRGDGETRKQWMELFKENGWPQ